MNGLPLPHPESEQLAATVPDPAARTLYQLLYRRRTSRPPTATEAQLFLAMAFGSASTLREPLGLVRGHFEISEVPDGTEPRLLLVGWTEIPASEDDAPAVSDRLRAEILAPCRCAQCGQTPLQDEIKLVVDMRWPSSWGGSAEPDNLQPLCARCSDGKREYLQVHAAHSDKIRRAASFDEPQRRLAELLKAFNGGWVRADLQGVASVREYQDDWQRRLRELRDLGWDYESKRRYHEGPRVRVYYRLIEEAPWPVDMRAMINAAAAQRRQERSSRR